MKVSVEELRRIYRPRTGTAITGWIPMSVFNAVEQELRPEMRKKMLRVHYRGPRVSPRQSSTHRADATHAVVYFRS